MGSATSIVRLSLESNQYEQKIRGAKKQFEDFTASIGINMKKMTAYGLAIGAASAAINKLTDEISQCITESIELAKAAEGIKMAFDRLNRPDLLNNLREATHGTIDDLELMKQSVKFDNFGLNLDQMGTFLAFAQQQAKDTGQSIDYLVDSIVTGLGRKSLPILDNLGLSATDIREKMKQTGDMTSAVAEIIKERMEAAGGYVETAADRAARADAELKNAMLELGETLQPLAETGESVFKNIEIAAINVMNNGIKPIIPMLETVKDTIVDIGLTSDTAKNAASTFFETMLTSMLKVHGPLGNIALLIKYIAGGGQDDMGAGVGNLGDVFSANGGTLPEITINGHKPRKNIAGSSSSQATPKIDDFQKALRKSILDPESLKNAREMMSPFAMMTDEAKRSMLGLADATEDLGGAMAQLGEKEVIAEVNQQMDDMNKKLAQEKMAFNLAAQSASAFGQALAGIEDPAAKAAGTVMQAVASIALGFATASANANTAGTGWGWLAWLAAGAAAMATTISTIHSLTGYASGGEIKGNSYSGDQIPIMANAGEIVLNRAQQGAIAAGLQSARGNNLTARVTGEQIVLAANNYLKRTGQGELVTWG